MNNHCTQPQAHPDRCGCEPDAFQIARHSKRLVEQQRERIADLEAECERLKDALDECDGDRWRLRHELAALKGQQVGQESEPAPKQHPDDAAVDRFAAAMKAKLARSREKGRHGWQNCTAPHLSAMLYDHLYKADPLDVGNFAMMLHQNGQAIELPFEARGRHTTPQPAPAQDVAPLLEALRVSRQYVVSEAKYEESAHNDLDLIDAALAAHDKQSGEVKP